MSYPPARYHLPNGEISSVFRSASAAATWSSRTAGSVAHLATSATTGGDYGLFRWT